jgi:uncharacterized peroxidase-related enzyme
MNKKQNIMDLNLELPDHGAMPDDLKKYFEVCKEKLGLVPNVLAAYSHEDEQLRAFSRFYNSIMFAETGLSPLEREMIAVAVSSRNHCFYCLTAHGAAVRELSQDPELGEAIAMNHRAADISQKQKSMLDFAVKLTDHPDEVEHSDRESLRKSGFSEKQIWDIANVASFYNMTNRVASAVDMKPNREYHYKCREKKTSKDKQ